MKYNREERFSRKGSSNLLWANVLGSAYSETAEPAILCAWGPELSCAYPRYWAVTNRDVDIKNSGVSLPLYSRKLKQNIIDNGHSGNLKSHFQSFDASNSPKLTHSLMEVGPS
jgi:hypothetical protein